MSAIFVNSSGKPVQFNLYGLIDNASVYERVGMLAIDHGGAVTHESRASVLNTQTVCLELRLPQSDLSVSYQPMATFHYSYVEECVSARVVIDPRPYCVQAHSVFANRPAVLRVILDTWTWSHLHRKQQHDKESTASAVDPEKEDGRCSALAGHVTVSDPKDSEDEGVFRRIRSEYFSSLVSTTADSQRDVSSYLLVSDHVPSSGPTTIRPEHDNVSSSEQEEDVSAEWEDVSAAEHEGHASSPVISGHLHSPSCSERSSYHDAASSPASDYASPSPQASPPHTLPVTCRVEADGPGKRRCLSMIPEASTPDTTSVARATSPIVRVSSGSVLSGKGSGSGRPADCDELVSDSEESVCTVFNYSGHSQDSLKRIESGEYWRLADKDAIVSQQSQLETGSACESDSLSGDSRAQGLQASQQLADNGVADHDSTEMELTLVEEPDGVPERTEEDSVDCGLLNDAVLETLPSQSNSPLLGCVDLLDKHQSDCSSAPRHQRASRVVSMRATVGRGRALRRIYSRSDDLRILRFLEERPQRLLETRGKVIWQDLETEMDKTRTWQSLKYRFLRYILPDLQSYNIENKQFLNQITRCHRQT